MAVPVADQRVLRGTSATLSWQYLDGDGDVADPGTVTVGITNAAGSTVVAAATATAGTGTAARTYTLAAANNLNLDLLTVTWTLTNGVTFTTLVEIVGGYFFTVAEARQAAPAMSDDTNYPTAAIIDARRQIEEEFEQICSVAFVPRYRRERVSPDYTQNTVLLDWPRIRTVRSITSYDSAGNSTAWSSPDLAQVIAIDEGVRLTSRAWRWFLGGDTIVEYEHGYDAPPAEIKRAAFQRLRYLVAKPSSGIPDRATTFSITDGGTYSLSTAGAYSTGQPDVDAVLGRYSLRIPGVA